MVKVVQQAHIYVHKVKICNGSRCHGLNRGCVAEETDVLQARLAHGEFVKTNIN